MTPGAFRQKSFLWTFWRFSAWKWAKLATIYSKGIFNTTVGMSFFPLTPHFCSEMKRNKNFEKVPQFVGFSFFEYFFRLSFFSFSYLFAEVIKLLLGLLPVQKFLTISSLRRAIFNKEQLSVVAGNFPARFSLKFLCIFVHISGSAEPMTLIWASLERSFPPAEIEYRCQFQSNVMTSEAKQRSTLITAGTGINGLRKFARIVSTHPYCARKFIRHCFKRLLKG